MTSLPSWLQEARASRQHQSEPAPGPDSTGGHTRPQPGDVRVARPMDHAPEHYRRLVCVLDVDAVCGFATVALLTDELDLATPADVRLPRETTGAQFDLLLELELVGPVWWAQLGPAIATVDLERACTASELRGGLPLRRDDDIRWTFREQELTDLHQLVDDCARTLVDGPDDAFVPHVDPELVSSMLGSRR